MPGCGQDLCQDESRMVGSMRILVEGLSQTTVQDPLIGGAIAASIVLIDEASGGAVPYALATSGWDEVRSGPNSWTLYESCRPRPSGAILAYYDLRCDGTSARWSAKAVRLDTPFDSIAGGRRWLGATGRFMDAATVRICVPRVDPAWTLAAMEALVRAAGGLPRARIPIYVEALLNESRCTVRAPSKIMLRPNLLDGRLLLISGAKFGRL
eukprot:3641399-Pyramimonas_sp.AAC.1